MMQLMDNIRSAWKMRFPYEVERVESDPEEDYDEEEPDLTADE